VHVAHGKTTDRLPTTRTAGPLSLIRHLACRLKKQTFRLCTFSLHFLDVYAEFSFVVDNNKSIGRKIIHILPTCIWEARSRRLYDADGPDNGPVSGRRPARRYIVF